MLLRVENLKKYFQTPRGMLHAVDDVSFSIEKGKTLGVVGESGCGKSTLGRVILHLLDSSGGKIFFEDEDITNVKKKHLKELQRSMQIIFQDPFSSLNPRMTVSELIREPLLITKTVPKDQIDRKVKEIMDTVGLAERLVNSYPHELDGGRRQRIGVARALVLNPKFIVCDVSGANGGKKLSSKPFPKSGTSLYTGASFCNSGTGCRLSEKAYSTERRVIVTDQSETWLSLCRPLQLRETGVLPGTAGAEGGGARAFRSLPSGERCRIKIQRQKHCNKKYSMKPGIQLIMKWRKCDEEETMDSNNLITGNGSGGGRVFR